MKQKRIIILFLMMSILLFGIFSLILIPNFDNFALHEKNDEFLNFELSTVDYTNATVISDGSNDIYWNDEFSYNPDITVDKNGTIHAVWQDNTDGVWGNDEEIMYASYTEPLGWSNITVISDGYNDIYWNDGYSWVPQIAVDNDDNVHVVWQDSSNGPWGVDDEVLYVRYTEASGWSNVTVISDGYDGIYWNDGSSWAPQIAVDNDDNVHVVWQDSTPGVWGGGPTDIEIMYASYSEALGWSNVTIISDGYKGIYWNDQVSQGPSIDVDNIGNIHVVWEDWTIGIWGYDYEIMYVSYTESLGWSNISLISDGYKEIYWNDGHSRNPQIAVDNDNNVHVVWEDDTDGQWGTDIEIMYSTLRSSEWSFPIIISDGYVGVYWNDGQSQHPSIAIDNSNNIHIVWHDDTNGGWGIDTEIMYSYYSKKTGWKLPKVISDGFMGEFWNTGASYTPAIAYRYEKIHVVWRDATNGVWGSDDEIMYSSISVTLDPGTFTLSTNAGSPDDDGTFDLMWTDAERAENYSVYRYFSYVSRINSSVNLLQASLTASSFNLTGYTSGTYYFIIEAENEIGSTLSNCISVEVQISSGGGIPFGNVYLLFVLIGIVGIIVYVKRKI